MIRSLFKLAFILFAFTVGGPLPLQAQTLVDASMSGAWFDPAHDGEGFLLEVLDGGQAVVYWFTYDEAGAQRWFIGTAPIQAGSITFDELLAGSGATFGEEFNSADVILTDAGELSIEWSSCDAAIAHYTVDGISGSQELTRLSTLTGLECPESHSLPSAMSGSWFDRRHDGEGLVLEVLVNGRALVYWFSYDLQGNPAWFFGLGEVENDNIAVPEMFITRGGRFGSQFDPAQVELELWGSLLVELGCHYGKLDYAAESAAFGSGKQTLTRLTSPGNPECEEPAPPNILLVIADDMGVDSSSQYDVSEDLPNTPVLDELAHNGLVFDNAWSNPSCSPTRAGILTGRFGVRTRVLTAGDVLSSEEVSLPEYIAQPLPGRYADAVIGKWHLGPERGSLDHPAELGIGHFAGILGGGVGDYENWPLTRDGQQTTETDYVTSKLVDLAAEWVEEQDQPWLLWLAFNAPHTPFHLPPASLHDRVLSGSTQDIEDNPRPYYLAAIEAMDSELGRLLDSLDPAERDNTLIIFIGDNGTPAQVAQDPFTQRRAKGTLYQGGINVPMFVSGPGVSRTGEREAALVNTTDIFATIAALAGVNVNDVHDSISFTGLFNGTRELDRTAQYSDKASEEGEEQWAVSDGHYKLIESASGQAEFYQIAIDPFEADDLLESGEAPDDKVEELRMIADKIRQ